MEIQYKGDKPFKKHDNDAGSDLKCHSYTIYPVKKKIIYKTNTKVNIPAGNVAFLLPRSSIRNYDLVLSNSVGVIDSGFVGEIEVTFNFTQDTLKDGRFYVHGDRIAQLVILPIVNPKWVYTEEFENTERGTGGHGSTGK